MEMVRGAVFDILQGQLGCGSRLPDTGRWLDLFAGTGVAHCNSLLMPCHAVASMCHIAAPSVDSTCDKYLQLRTSCTQIRPACCVTLTGWLFSVLL